MTVASTVRRAAYDGTGAQVIFPYTFPILNAAHLRVVVRRVDGNEDEQPQGVAYSYTGIGKPAGGNVTMVTAPAIGELLIILRELPLTQGLDLRNQGPYLAEEVERALDQAVMITQQLRDDVDRSLRLPETETGTDALTLIPPLDVRRSRVLGFDADGNPIATLANIFNFTGGSDGVGFAINVRQLGAVGDGVTNDQLAIQAALDACAAAGGGKVLLPAGTYRLIGSYAGYVPDTSGGWPYDGPIQHLSITSSNIEIVGDGIGRTTIISGQASCIFAAHHSGQLQNIVLRGLSIVNDGGIQTTYQTNVCYWSGRIIVEDCEFLDWSLCFYGRAPAPGSVFKGNRFLWTRGREGVGYTGHASNWDHPCVGIIWPGDDVLVDNNYFDGALTRTWLSSGSYPDDLPTDWAYDGGGINWWPDVVRQPADGLLIQFNSGGIFSNNTVRNNGVEGVLFDYNASYTVQEKPCSIIGNTIDGFQWNGSQIHYPGYGISCKNRRALTISGNSVARCDMGICAESCQGSITGNSTTDCAQSVWVINCNDTTVSGNTIQAKMVLSTPDLSVIYNCERGIFLTTPLRCRVSGNTIRGPTSGWANGSKTTTAGVVPGQIKIYLNNTTGLVATVEGVTSGNWLAFNYIPNVSLGVPIPIGSIGSDGGGPFINVLNSDWAATLGTYSSGTTVTVFNDNPFYIAGIASSEAVGTVVSDNTITGFLYGISHSVSYGSPNYLVAVNNTVSGAAIANFGPSQISQYVYDGSLPYPALTATGQVKGLTLVAEGPAASASGPHITGKFASDADLALDVLIYDHDNISFALDMYYTGSVWKASDTSAVIITKKDDRLRFIPKSGLTKGSTVTLDTNNDPQVSIDALTGVLRTIGRQVKITEYGSGGTTILTVNHEVAVYTAAGPGDYFIPPLCSLGTWDILIKNAGGSTLTVQRSGASDVFSDGGAASFTLATGKWVRLVSKGSGNLIYKFLGP